MAETSDFDAIARRLRARIAESMPNGVFAKKNPENVAETTELNGSTKTGQLLSKLEALKNILDVRFTSHRILIGRPLIRLRNFVRELLIPIFSQQAAFNDVVFDLSGGLEERLDQGSLQIDLIRSELLALQADGLSQTEFKNAIKVIGEKLSFLEARMNSCESMWQALTNQVDAVSSHLEARMNSCESTLQALINRVEAVSSHLEARMNSCESTLQPLINQVEAVRTELGQEASKAQSYIDRRFSQNAEEIEKTRLSMEQVVDDLEAKRLRIAAVERKLRRLVYELEPSKPNLRSADSVADSKSISPDVFTSFDYFGFEDRVRPSETELRNKLQLYLRHFAGLNNVLDLGCGRGEFLDVLRKANINALGVDSNLDMVLYCKDKDLNVVHDDAIEYLRSLPEKSLGGIYAAQIIEHLGSGEGLALVDLAYRKLNSNGILLIETINPESLFVLYRWFWMDPTHQRLVHPETLRYCFECAGFREVNITFSTPPDVPSLAPLVCNGAQAEAIRSFNKWSAFLNQFIFGPQEYTAVGRR